MLNWQILLTESAPGTYEMRVRYPGAPRGGHRFVRPLPPDFSDYVRRQGEEANCRVWRRAPGEQLDDGLLFCAASLDTLKDIGTRLHDALFRVEAAGSTKDLTGEFLTLRESAANTESDFRLDIDLTDAPQLARVPWEALYFAEDDLFLGIDTKTNIVRKLAPDRPGPLPAPIEPPIRMLVAVANPLGDLEAGAEVADIEGRLSGLLDQSCTRYEVQTLPQATRSQLGSRVEDWKPHIIHFIGHGGFDDDKGLIYLHDERDARKRDPIDSATLRDFVRNDRPWLVVLNSCLSGAAARAEPFGGAAQNLLRVNIPFVVAMQSPISDQAAVRFSQRFYASLMRGDPVAVAVTRGRNAIKGLGEESLRTELITPVLYMSGQSDRLALVERSSGKSSARFGFDRTLAVIGAVGTVVAAVLAYLQLQVSAPPEPQVRSRPAASAAASYPRAGAAARATPRATPPLVATGATPLGRARARPRPPSAVLIEDEGLTAYAAAVGEPPRGDLAPYLDAIAPDARPTALPPAFVHSPEVLPPPGYSSAPAGAARLPTPESLLRELRTGSDREKQIRELVAGTIGGSFLSSIFGETGGIIAGAVGRTTLSEGSPATARHAAELLRSAQVASLVRRAFQANSAESTLPAGFSMPRGGARRYAYEDALRALSLQSTDPTGYTGLGGPIEEPEFFRESLLFAPGRTELSEDAVRDLEYAALAARNGARIELTAVVAERDSGLAPSRLSTALEFLLARGATASRLAADRARADTAAATLLQSRGVGGLVEMARESWSAVERRRGRPPVSIIASFAPGSSEPLAETLLGFDYLLRTEPGADLMVHLVGRVDSEEGAASGTKLAEARVRYMADRLRLFGAPEGSIVRGAAPARADAINPHLERRVDASLAFKSAARLEVPLAPQPLPPATAAALDRLAGWLTRYRYFGVHLGSAEAAPDPDLAVRTERLRSALHERGIADDRITVEPAAPAGAAEPAAAASPDPVEIVIVPLE